MKATQATALRGGLGAVMAAAALLTFAVGALPATAAGSKSASAASAASSSAKGALSGVVNVNTASAEELQLLPGVGVSRATAIVDVRKRRGGFESIEELTDVKGIGPTMLDKMRPHVALSGRTTARRVDAGSKSSGARP